MNTNSMHEREPHPSLRLHYGVHVGPRPLMLLGIVAPRRHIFHPGVKNGVVVLVLMLCVIQDHIVHVVVLSFQEMVHPLKRWFLRKVLHLVMEVEGIQEKHFQSFWVLEILFMDWKHPRVHRQQTFYSGITLTNLKCGSTSK